jgi:hypothetical protein
MQIIFLEALSQPNTGAPAVLVDELDRTTFHILEPEGSSHAAV